MVVVELLQGETSTATAPAHMLVSWLSDATLPELSLRCTGSHHTGAHPVSGFHTDLLKGRSSTMPAARTLTLTALIVVGGCFHATIETGLTPSTRVLEQKWASSWIYGLVPPKTVETASRCPDGVAKVETRLSFLNQVVHILTFGIYTPMDIRVTCALPAETSSLQGAMLTVPAHADNENVRAAFAAAAEQAAKGRAMVLVRFER